MSRACRHDEWEVTALGSDLPLEWRSNYPPPPPGTRLLLADGELPDAVADSGTDWIVVETTWFVGLCPGCDQTVVTPLVVVAPDPHGECKGYARG